MCESFVQLYSFLGQPLSISFFIKISQFVRGYIDNYYRYSFNTFVAIVNIYPKMYLCGGYVLFPFHRFYFD